MPKNDNNNKNTESPWWITPENEPQTPPFSSTASQLQQLSAFKDPTTCKIAIAVLLYVLDDERRLYFVAPVLTTTKDALVVAANLVNSNGEDSLQERKADFDFLKKTILETQQQKQQNASVADVVRNNNNNSTDSVSDSGIFDMSSDLEANASAQVLRLRATIDERIALLILFVQACLRKGRYSARSRTNVRRLAQVLGIPFLPVQDFEKQTAVAMDQEVARRETALAVDKNRTKENLIKFAKISGFVVVGGGLMFVTGGLAAPALAGALGAFAGTVATSIGAAATVLGVGGGAVATITGGAALITTAAAPLLTATSITAAFGVGGAALAASRAHNRMRGGGTITLRFVEDQENVAILALSNFGFDDDDDDDYEKNHHHESSHNRGQNNGNDDDNDEKDESSLGETTTLRLDKAQENEINIRKNAERNKKQIAEQSNNNNTNIISNINNKNTITSTSASSEIATKIVAEVADDNIAVRPGPIVPLNYRPEATRHALESVRSANRSLVISIENLVQIESVTLELVQCVVETGCPILSAPRKIPPQCCALLSIRNRPFFPTGSACYIVLKVNKKNLNQNSTATTNNDNNDVDQKVSDTTMKNILSEKIVVPKVGDALLWLFLAIDLIGGVKGNVAWMPITPASPKFPMAAESLVEQGEFLDAKAKALNSNGTESKTLNAATQPYIVEVRNEDDKLARVMFKSKLEKTSLQQTTAGLPFLHLKTQFTDVVSDLVRHAAIDIPTYWTGSHPLTMICAVSNELSTTSSVHAPILTKHLRVYDGKPMDKVSAVRELPSNKESFGAIAVVSEKSGPLPFSSNLVQFVVVFAVPVPTRGKGNAAVINNNNNNNSKTPTSFSTNSGIVFVSLEIRISDTRTSNKVQSIRFKVDTHISDPLRKDFITTSTEEEKMTEIPLLLNACDNANNPQQLLLESSSAASPPIISLQHESFCLVLEALNPAWFLSSTIGSDANIASQLLKTHENAVGSCALLKVRFVDPDFGRTARRKLSQVIGISGFIPVLDSARDNADQLLPMLAPALRSSALTRSSEVYLAEWEIEQQKFFYDSLRKLSKSLTAKDVVRTMIKKEAKSQVKGHVMAFLATNALFAGVQGISAVSGAFSLPAYVAWLMEAIDNSYAVLSNRAKDAGEALAETLKSVKEKKKAKQQQQQQQQKDKNIDENNKTNIPEDKFKNEQDVRPVTLVGVSWGGAVAIYCAIALAEAGELSILENVIVAGVPYYFSKTEWRKARKAIVGRFVNVHSNDDPMLRLLYKGNTLKLVGGGQPAGLGKVRNISGLENVDARAVIRTHLDYGDKMENVMKLIPQREEYVYFDRKKHKQNTNNNDNDDDDQDEKAKAEKNNDESTSSSSSDEDDDDDEVEQESGLPATAVVKIKDSPTMIMNVLAATIEKTNLEDAKLVERKKQRKKEEDEQRKMKEKIAATASPAIQQQTEEEMKIEAEQTEKLFFNDDDDEVRTLTFIVTNNACAASSSTIVFSRAASDIHPSLTPVFRPPTSSSSHELNPGDVTSWSYRFNQGQCYTSVFTMFSALRFEVFKNKSSSSSEKENSNNNINTKESSTRKDSTHQLLLFVENGVDDIRRYADVSNKAKSKILVQKRAFARPSVAIIDLIDQQQKQQENSKASSTTASSSSSLFAATKLFLFSTTSADSAEAKRRKHIVLVVSISDVSEEYARSSILNKKILPPSSEVCLKEFDNQNDDEDVVIGDLDPDRENESDSSIFSNFLNVFTSALSPKSNNNDINSKYFGGAMNDEQRNLTRMRLSTASASSSNQDWEIAPFGTSNSDREEAFMNLIKESPSVSPASPIFLVCACNFVNRSKSSALQLLHHELVLRPEDDDNGNIDESKRNSSIVMTEFLLGRPPQTLSVTSSWNTDGSTILYISINLCSLHQYAQSKEHIAVASFYFQPADNPQVVIRADLCLVIEQKNNKVATTTSPTTSSPCNTMVNIKKANVTSVFSRIFKGSIGKMMMSANVDGNNDDDNAVIDDDEFTKLESTVQIQNKSDSGRVGNPVAVDVMSKIGGFDNVVVAEVVFDLK